MSGDKVNQGKASGLSTLVRPRFGPGMLLQHEDLEQVTNHAQELSRLMFRSFFGCGVVCGLVVEKPEEKCGRLQVAIGAGLALTICGDPIHVPKGACVAIGDDCEEVPDGPLWVVLCRTTKRCAQRSSMCGCDEDDAPPLWTRERDGFEIKVVTKRPDCGCGCLPLEGGNEDEYRNRDEHRSECWCVDPEHPCYRKHYEGVCNCIAGCDDCSDCDCQCVLLARLVSATKGSGDDEKREWSVDHSVRRFIRPVLMRDPVVEGERREKAAAAMQTPTAAPKGAIRKRASATPSR